MRGQPDNSESVYDSNSVSQVSDNPYAPGVELEPQHRFRITDIVRDLAAMTISIGFAVGAFCVVVFAMAVMFYLLLLPYYEDPRDLGIFPVVIIVMIGVTAAIPVYTTLSRVLTKRNRMKSSTK